MAYEWENSTLEQKKAKLQELQAKLAQAKQDSEYKQQRGGLTRAAEAMMQYDPTGAFNILDKREALDVKRMQALKDNQYDPDAVRFKLASRSNAISGQLAGMAANNPAYQPLLDEQNRIKKELAKDNPSIKDVYADQVTPPPSVVPGAVTVATYDSIIKEIEGATRGTFQSVENKVATDKGAAALAPEQKKRIEELLAAKKRELFPGKVDVAAKVDELITDNSTKPVPAAYARYDKSLNAYNAAKASHDSGAIGAALGNYLYSLRPEAVNSGDIDLLEAAVRDSDQQKVKGLLNKFGFGSMMSTDFNAIASQLAASAYKKLADDRAANIKQIKGLLSIYDQAAVERRADMYYKVPVRYTKNKDEAAGNPVLGAPTGGKTSGPKKPNAKDYPDYESFNKAMKEYKANGGK